MNIHRDYLKSFQAHEFVYHHMAGEQAVGGCPFCQKPEHFYLNTSNGLWDCKRCGEKGNLETYLQKMSEVYERNLKADPKLYNKLGILKKMPISAFQGIGMGWTGKAFSLPIRNPAGRVCDIRTCQPGGKFRATPGCELGLLWIETLKDTREEVYVCEGEWDGIALRWLLGKVKLQSKVVAVPGASVFKNDWVPKFTGMNVTLLYDNDLAGVQGRNLAYNRLNGTARRIRAAAWPEGLANGYDVRDHVCDLAITQGKVRQCWRDLHALFVPMVTEVTVGKGGAEPPPPEDENTPIPSREEVTERYRRWLHLPSDEVLQVIFGAAMANKMQGDPVWLFLVAPPGGSKSELLSSLSKSRLVETITTLTPQSLISGSHGVNGNDPSLLPKLNEKILVIKDFTTILSMHQVAREEIFGVLRDIYDGRTEKSFGTGMKRVYTAHFGILAGVTPKIEEFSVTHQSLGERFLRYRLKLSDREHTEPDRIRRALANINHESVMRADLCQVASACLRMPLPEKLPTLPPQIEHYTVNLAQLCATLRSAVSRNSFTQVVLYKPSIEVGTRLAKQLIKLGMGIAMYRGLDTIDMSVYRIIRKVALDTAPDRTEEIVKQLWKHAPTLNDAVNIGDLSKLTHLPMFTCTRVLQDMELLKMVERSGKGMKQEWRLTENMRRLITDSMAYEPPKS